MTLAQLEDGTLRRQSDDDDVKKLSARNDTRLSKELCQIPPDDGRTYPAFLHTAFKCRKATAPPLA